jgi:hypothetical protein
MKKVIKTHLPGEEAPIEWAVSADGILYTAQIPIRADGSIETGDITKQADLTFTNLMRTLEAAGGKLRGCDPGAGLSDAQGGFRRDERGLPEVFLKPYPNRATVIVAGLHGARRGSRSSPPHLGKTS